MSLNRQQVRAEKRRLLNRELRENKGELAALKFRTRRENPQLPAKVAKRIAERAQRRAIRHSLHAT